MAQHPSKTWADEERHFLQKCVVEYRCGREVLHDMMGRKYGDKYAREGRGPYTAQRIWDEYTQRERAGKPVALNRYIYQTPGSAHYSAADVTLRRRLDTNTQTLATQATGKNPMTRKEQRQITLGAGQVAAHYATGNEVVGPLVPGTALPAGATSSSSTQMTGANSSYSITHQSVAVSGTADHSGQPPMTAPIDADTTSKAEISGNRGTRGEETRPTQQLPMIHRNALRMRARDTFPLTRRSPFEEGYVDHGTLLYAHGGQVARFKSLRGTHDAMLCDTAVCDECGEDLAAPTATSPFDGMPFVHAGRDAVTTSTKLAVFVGVASQNLAESVVPESVRIETMVFTVDGKEQLTDVKVCNSRDCPICLAAAAAAAEVMEGEAQTGG